MKDGMQMEIKFTAFNCGDFGIGINHSSQESLKLSRLAKTLLFRTKQAEELTSRKMIE